MRWAANFGCFSPAQLLVISIRTNTEWNCRFPSFTCGRRWGRIAGPLDRSLVRVRAASQATLRGDDEGPAEGTVPMKSKKSHRVYQKRGRGRVGSGGSSHRPLRPDRPGLSKLEAVWCRGHVWELPPLCGLGQGQQFLALAPHDAEATGGSPGERSLQAGPPAHAPGLSITRLVGGGHLPGPSEASLPSGLFLHSQ